MARQRSAPIERDDSGAPEPSAKEVELMLEAADRGETPTPLSLPPELRAAVALEKETGPIHQLDLEPVGSKIVVVSGGDEQGGAFIGGPAGTKRLPDDDVAQKLPIGARIRKVAEDRYVGEQLSPAEERKPLVRATAADVIAAFVVHFHGPAPEEQD